MAGRFDPATEALATAISAGRYGPLEQLQFTARTALLWEGYERGLDSIALDVLHGTFDTVACAPGRPDRISALAQDGPGPGGAPRRPPGRPLSGRRRERDARGRRRGRAR